MTKTRVIRVFSFIMALTLVFAMFPSPVYSDDASFALTPADKQRFGAWVASALMAGQIMVESVAMPIANVLNYLSDPLDLEYSYVDTAYQEFMDKNKIVIDDNHVQIDGKWYDNVWLSHDAAEKFRINANDLKTAWQVASNSSGVFANGYGTLNGIPLYEIGGNIRTQEFITDDSGSYDNGIYSTDFTTSGNHKYWHFYNSDNNQVGLISINGYSGLSSYVSRINIPSNNFIITARGTKQDYTNTWNMTSPFGSTDVIDNTPFDYNWVSKDVNLDPLEPDEGLSILVPHEDMEPFYNSHPEFNPQVNPDINIDVDSPDFPNVWDMVDDLLDIISTVIKLLPNGNFPSKYENEPEPYSPIEPDPDPIPYPDPDPETYPDPDPDPDTPLTDINWKNLFDVLKNIFNKLANIDVTSQTIANKLVEFKNRFEDWAKSIRDSIVDKLQEIKESLDDLVNKIVHGNADWFSDIVDAIKQPFLPWLNIFKSGVSIWHYVVEWLQSIHEPFVFFFGVLNSLGYTFVLPFYAVAASCIVIAIYRRFGR